MDTAKYDEMVQRLEPLTQPGSSFRHTARELLALSACAAANDPEAPAGVRSRVEVLNSLLADASKP